MFKEFIYLEDNVSYNPLRNVFVEGNSPDQIDPEDVLLKIKGHEEKIFEYLISKYNNYVSKQELEDEFPECKDPYDKTLDRLNREKIKGKLHLFNLIQKTKGKAILYLLQSPFSTETNDVTIHKPLLCWENYYVDYDRILSDCASDTTDVPQSILDRWIEECKKASSYDQKCIIILECMGFLPAFGPKADKKEFLKKIKELIYRFSEADIQYYSGTELLIFSRDVILAAIEYIYAQLEIIIPDGNGDNLEKAFTKMLQKFSTISIPKNTSINPLLLVVYYHYLGLVYYRNYLYKRTQDFLISAKDSMEKALHHAQNVDMHLQIWKAFLTYNLGRVYSELGENEQAIHNIEIAVELREGLAECPFFSDSIKHQLRFEYLLGRVVETDIKKKAEAISENDARAEYSEIKEDAKTITNSDTQSYIYRLLSVRMDDKK